MLEALEHKDNTFVTLTYADEKLAINADGLPVLCHDHFQGFMKRLRKAVAPHRLRFYMCGEYGDRSWRPHYHMALFGYPNCEFGNTRVHLDNCCKWCDLIREKWQRGGVLLGSLEWNSAHYVCGYVTKKMTAVDDGRLQGRTPEYARMSNRPGIGAFFMDNVADAMLKFNLEEREGDVPSSLRTGNRLLPLGRYLKRRLRERIGRDVAAPEEVLDEIAQELSDLRALAWDNETSVTEEYQKKNVQKWRNFDARQALYTKKRLTQ